MGATSAGMQPDGDWLYWANRGFELKFWLIDDLVLNYAALRLGRFTKHFGFEGFNITNAVPWHSRAAILKGKILTIKIIFGGGDALVSSSYQT